MAGAAFLHALSGWGQLYLQYTLALSGLASLTVVVIEMISGFLLTWAAIWRLESGESK